MRFSLLGSGSSGNVAYFEAAADRGASTRLFVDAGLSRVEIERRLQKMPSSVAVALDQIDGVLLTHEHNDHAQHAKGLKRPLWATAGTRLALGLESGAAQLVRAGERYTIGGFTVTAVGIPHDAAETVGYVLADAGGKVGIVTDCGHDAPEVAAAFAGCDALVLETNYDVTMLRYGPYPPSLKRRVSGRLGHLSNEQAASLLKQIMQLGPAPKLVIAAHISQANNRPQLAKSALDRVLGRPGRVVAASPRGTPIFAVEGGRVRAEPMRHEQLAFSFTPQAQLAT